MSSNAINTLALLIDKGVDPEIVAAVAIDLGVTVPAKPEKVTKAKKNKGKKASKSKPASSTGKPSTTKFLCSANRKAYIEAAMTQDNEYLDAIREHFNLGDKINPSTFQCAKYALEVELEVPGYEIGEGNRARVEGREITKRSSSKPVATGKKGKKNKASKPVETVEVKAEPKSEGMPRRASGTVAPKREWAIRRMLEAQGLNRVEVDAKTAKAMKVLNG